jgi:hypothetical protein
MRFLDALCEGSFVARADGRVSFFPWGALGPGYAIPSEVSYRRLRRETRRLLALGIFGIPVVAALGAPSVGGHRIVAIGIAIAGLGTLRLALLTRGLERIPDRITRAESNARVARALRRLGRGADAQRRSRRPG